MWHVGNQSNPLIRSYDPHMESLREPAFEIGAVTNDDCVLTQQSSAEIMESYAIRALIG